MGLMVESRGSLWGFELGTAEVAAAVAAAVAGVAGVAGAARR